MAKTVREFNGDINKIYFYRQKLLDRIKHNKSIDTINEWLIDNYYTILENKRYINAEFSGKKFGMIKLKRKKLINSLLFDVLRNENYAFNETAIYDRILKYQKDNKDCFSYLELNYMFDIIRVLLVEELHNLCLRLDFRLETKIEMSEKYNYILKHINDKKFNIGNHIKIDKSILENPYYVEELNYMLRKLGIVSKNVFVKMNEIFNSKDLSMKEIIKKAHMEYTGDSVLMSNIFNFLKVFDRVELEYFYKRVSLVERLLNSEKADIYSKMFENNKKEYRYMISRHAKKKNIGEYKYALKLVEKSNEESRHIGFNLFKEVNLKRRTFLYIGGVCLFTFLLSFFTSLWLGSFTFLLLIVPMSVIVVELLNQILMHTTRINTLNKIKFENGVPYEYSSMIVIPTILGSADKVYSMFDNLESYYLSNKSENLYFTLVGDAINQDTIDMPYDDEVVAAGLKRVEELNLKYGKKLFYFIYRNRFYNESEGCYLGYERKRGAVEHFNKVLLGEFDKTAREKWFKCDTFDGFDKKIKYVITLDQDTKVVLGTALKLIGTMAHPMNKAILSEDKTKVISGYGILQPRISIDVETTNKSHYSQLFAGLGGLDIYTSAYFEMYQDVFSEALFAGKGIYDLEVFDTILSGTLPKNLILSHDMIEGIYLRAGLINDLEVFDDYPSSYLKDAGRHHRWNRGDWQTTPWFGKRVRNEKNEKIKNPINILSKWKIFEDLRRSTAYFFLTLLLFYGVIFGGENSIYFFLIVLFVISIPIFFFLISKLFYRTKKDYFLKYYLTLLRGVIAIINKSIVILTVLPYEVWLYADSTIKALYRMLISKKKLLSWVTAEELEQRMNDKFITYVKAFKVNYVAAGLLILASYLFNKNAILSVYFIASLWMFAPVLMHFISKKPNPDKPELNESQKEEIRDIALRTWKYFDDNLKEESHFLIPDNYQYNRSVRLDHRTSPTNIGFSLTSIVSAYELAFIKEKRAIYLLENIINTLEKMEKWNGHLFNWYDIYTLEKLPNYFVSTVDNGNYISSLFVVRSLLFDLKYPVLIKKVNGLIDEVHFSKLYNEKLEVFSIGYDYMEEKLIPYHYNNFASESRLASFVAIAKGDVPFKHWFCLDKTLTKFKQFKGVVSWGGTSFEYFMPLLFMHTYNHTLLDESYHFAHFAQRKFMMEIDKKLPWGMSESAYNELDDSQGYKYKAFGVPYLKFKEDPYYPIVISPYSSIMAISIDEIDVYNNINKLKNLNMYGKYGFYEAYDHEDKEIVKAYYAHHQGMSLASIANYLKDNVIRNHFHMNKEVDSVEMLLKEKVQLDVYIDLKTAKYKRYNYNIEHVNYDIREFTGVSKYSEYSVLSNGFYSILLDDKGRGISKYKNLQINRYRKVTDQDYGTFVYIKNARTKKVWTNTYAPMNIKPDKYKTIFSGDRIKYIREDEGIVTTTEVIVPKDHTAEIRKITLKNNTSEVQKLEVTSYSELIMCRNEVDVSHRTFNAMTISGELDVQTKSLIFKRKSKTKENTTYYIINRMFLDKEDDKFSYETDRTKFIGRNNDLRNADAIFESDSLSNNIGASMDPIMSIRRTVTLNPKEKREVYLVIGFGKSMEQVKNIVSAYETKSKVDNAIDETAVYNHMIDSYSGITIDQKRVYNKFLKYLYNKAYRKVGMQDRLKTISDLSQDNLWKFGISGDIPIILVEVSNTEDAYFIEEVLKLYEFFKSKTIYIDVVIINNEEPGKEELVIKYIDQFIYRINNLNYFENTLGDIYNISNRDITEDQKEKIRLLSAVVLDANEKSSLEDQLDGLYERVEYDINAKPYVENLEAKLPSNIEFYNGYGGFVSSGREYLVSDINTPMPWINVLAGNKFGTIVSSSMGGFTYAFNSNQYRISSWSNDITRDNISEKLLINGHIFKPSMVRHGFGYTIMMGETNEYKISVKIFVGLNNKKKYMDIKVTNKLNKTSKIDLDLSIKGVLGFVSEQTSNFIVSEFDENKNILILENKYNNFYRDVKVFLGSSESIIRCDYNSYYKSIGVSFVLDKKEDKDVTFILGVLDGKEESSSSEYENTIKNWENTLNVIQVDTPDKSFNYVINGWYLYQIYSSRLMARAGFYQAGGATGFRDQLQDVMGVIYSNPELTRNQILEQAKHQFTDGGVLHWWHEDMMFGIRATYSDDYLWLIYVTNEYLEITEDYDILNEEVSFVQGDELDGESEKGIHYSYTEEKETLYEHMKLCIERALSRMGRHGLPLMGCGDWNDGMSAVGHKGKGESVFVGFFLYDLLNKMSKIAERKTESEFSKNCSDKAHDLKINLNNNAWDGNWYLRAYYDNGNPMGSRNNLECQIDLLSQSWSILSGVAPKDRRKTVHREVEKRLVDEENKIIKLLTPAFENTKDNPGYIKDYLPGIRENGGQYTHAALWYILSLIKTGNANKAYEYYQMINPINRTNDNDKANKYKVEPYALVADIYSNPKLAGRGGWSWHTGSASWSYKIAIEEILGFKKRGETLLIEPNISSEWDKYTITYKYKTSIYIITVLNDKHLNGSVVETIADENVIDNNIIRLVDDGDTHKIVIKIKE